MNPDEVVENTEAPAEEAKVAPKAKAKVKAPEGVVLQSGNVYVAS